MRGAYLAWFTITLFYFYQYILRISPGIMIDQLRNHFQVTAESFATLGTLYLLAYSLLQIPLGIIVDKIGVRRTVLWSTLLCITGSTLFSQAESFIMAQVARLLIGAGSASALMCALKVVADQFPPGKRGMLMGATLSLGVLGALITGKLLVPSMEKTSWNYVFESFVLIGLVMFALLFFTVKTYNRARSKTYIASPTVQSTLTRVIEIIKTKEIILYGILAIGLYTPLSAIADLWGTAFLMQKYSLSQAQAANTSTMMYLGLAIGSLILPWLCEQMNALNEAIFYSGIMILLIFMIILYGPVYSNSTVTILVILLGFFCGAEMMCFTGALMYSNRNNSGEIIGVVNTLNMLGGAILQQFIGFGLDFQWSGSRNLQGIRVYNTEQYVYALSVLTVIIFLCVLASTQLKTLKAPQREE
jgi:MFS family permease